MKLLLEDAKAFSKCPRFYWFDRGAKKIHPSGIRLGAFKLAVQKAYSYQLGGHKPTWRSILGWVDKVIFKNIDVTSDEAIERGRKLSESVLLPLRNWYENVFVSEHIEGYINVPVEYTVAGHQFHTIVPLLKLTDPITAVVIDDVVTTRLQLYNDILARGTGLLVSRKLAQEPVILEHMLLGPSSALERVELECDQELNRRAEKVLVQIADQIVDRVNYPSITSMCNTCIYRKDCLL